VFYFQNLGTCQWQKKVEKATKAMFEVLIRGKIHNLSVNVRLFGSLPLEKSKILVFSTLTLSAKTYNIQKRHQVVFEDPLWFPTLSLYDIKYV
jgi:hypothetical protein